MRSRNYILTLAATFCVLARLSAVVMAQEILPDGSKAAELAISGFKIPDGMKMEVFAAEPQVASPVAICIDEKGRVYAAEEYRFNRGTPENRTQDFFLEDDLQIDSLEDRLALYKKFEVRFEGGMDWFTKVSDQVRILEDRDGDGRADFSKIFAGGFNEPLDGLAAGLIARDGDVYLTNIPHLWLLRDTDGDGVADVRKSLHRGFGVNCGFLGHDLHGLVWGPDGRLYFSVGDRGFNLKTPEGRHLYGPRRGAVFRCEADGSDLRVVHVGLRNPQELAFDEFGNLFAADNNCDKGDLSRLVYVVEGGDSGWNMAYQTIPEPYQTGPWHAEKMWHVNAPDQPAWLIPPVGALGAGPSGFTYYPGTGLSDRYRGHFFLCNYTGNGGIESFAVEPNGAAFKIVDEHNFLKPIKATDVDFGYDGKMYVADFVNLDWSGKSLGGRIYTLFDPARVGSDKVADVRTRFAKGFKDLSDNELVSSLRHPDMRVRQRCQFELANRDSDNAITAFMLATVATRNANGIDRLVQFGRLHAIWAIGQRLRRGKSKQILPLLRDLLVNDQDSEVRSQVAKVLGEVRDQEATPLLIGALHNDSARLRFFAAEALGRIGDSAAIDPLFEMLERNADSDLYVRHAGVVALVSVADRPALLSRVNAKSDAVRLAALLALRRTAPQQLTQFLLDPNLRIVTEAARGINDLHIDDQTPALARFAARVKGSEEPLPDALIRRVINANFRLGESSNAVAIVELATNRNLNPAMRAEAVLCLADWNSPGKRDRVTGYWRPVDVRPTDAIQKVIEGSAAALLSSADGTLPPSILALVGKYDIKVDDGDLAKWAVDEERTTETRSAVLELLASRKAEQTPNLIKNFLTSKHATLRITARRMLARNDPAAAVASVEQSTRAASATTAELQAGLRLLSEVGRPDADILIAAALRELVTGDRSSATKWPHVSNLELDVVEAASTRKVGLLSELLTQYAGNLKQASESDPLSKFRPAKSGGDPEAGRSIFSGHRKAQCLRCHKINGVGGDAGPDLSKVAERAKGDRAFMLESLVNPHAKLAKGFGTVTVVLEDGKVINGTVASESDTTLVLRTSEGQTREIQISSIEQRVKPQSPMPPMGEVLTLRELRDVVEYLSTLR
jgi:quinoprotein glucose dehydrogenase